MLAVVIISVVMVIIGIFTSNTACASIMIPVVIGVAVEGHFHPLTLLFPVTCCCSCAFLLPSSTPPNLIAYTSKSFTTSDLFIAGLIVSVFCIIFFDLNTFTIFPAVIGYNWREFPSWAVSSVCLTTVSVESTLLMHPSCTLSLRHHAFLLPYCHTQSHVRLPHTKRPFPRVKTKIPSI